MLTFSFILVQSKKVLSNHNLFQTIKIVLPLTYELNCFCNFLAADSSSICVQALVSPCRVLGAQNSAFHTQYPVSSASLVSPGHNGHHLFHRWGHWGHWTLAHWRCWLSRFSTGLQLSTRPAALIAIYSVECLWSSHKMSPHGKLYHYWILTIDYWRSYLLMLTWSHGGY